MKIDFQNNNLLKEAFVLLGSARVSRAAPGVAPGAPSIRQFYFLRGLSLRSTSRRDADWSSRDVCALIF